MNLWKQLPDSLKYGLLIAGAILFAAGVVRIDDIRAIFTATSGHAEIDSKPEEKSSTIQFVLTDIQNNAPIPNANVVFIFNGAPEPRYTDDFGYVSITIPTRQEVRVQIKKEGYQVVNRTINLTADLDKTVEYKMEPIESEDSSKENQFNEGSQLSENDPELFVENEVLNKQYVETGISQEQDISTQGKPPEEIVELYFFRVEHGLYREAFDMLSQNYVQIIYFDKGFTPDSAFQDYVSFWERCDIDYRNLFEENKTVQQAVVSYERRYFCNNDSEVGRSYEFQKREMTIVRNSAQSDWKIDAVSKK